MLTFALLAIFCFIYQMLLLLCFCVVALAFFATFIKLWVLLKLNRLSVVIEITFAHSSGGSLSHYMVI